LVFGNEHAGVTDELRALCDGNFIIPQIGMISSLNISVACAVTIYEAFRQRSSIIYDEKFTAEKKNLWEDWASRETLS
jgi:tRNA (guanosine-2'-O-)-methyltransferase